MKKLLLWSLVLSGWFLVNHQHCNSLLRNKEENKQLIITEQQSYPIAPVLINAL